MVKNTKGSSKINMPDNIFPTEERKPYYSLRDGTFVTWDGISADSYPGVGDNSIPISKLDLSSEPFDLGKNILYGYESDTNRIVDANDVTKQFKFDAVNLTKSTLRTYNAPNASGTIALVASSAGAIANTDITGLGTMSVQNYNTVNIIGGSIGGSTTIAVTSTPIHDCTYHDQITVDQSCSATGEVINVGNGATNMAMAQTFLAGASKQLTHCEVIITRVGTPTDAVYIALYDTSAGIPTGALRTYSGLVQARDIVDGATQGFFFPRYAPSSDTGNWLIAGNTYGIALFRTGAIDANNYYSLTIGSGNLYPAGQIVRWTGSVWQGVASGSDLNFATYYGETTYTGFALDQLLPANGILPIQNLGTGTLTPGAVLTVPASGNSGLWTTTPVFDAITVTTVNNIVITQPETPATITIAAGGSLVTVGAFAVTLTAIAPTALTLPTSGTLATEAFVSDSYAPLDGAVFTNPFGWSTYRHLTADAYTIGTNNEVAVEVLSSSQSTLTLPIGATTGTIYIISVPYEAPAVGCIVGAGAGWAIGSATTYTIGAGEGIILIADATLSRWNILSLNTINLQILSGLSSADSNFIVGSALGWVVESGATVRTSLGLGTMAVETATNYVTKALYDAYSILMATTDDTPIALIVGQQTLVGRLTGGAIAAISIGIADDNITQIDQADIAVNDYAKFTANGLSGRSYTEVLSDIGAAATVSYKYKKRIPIAATADGPLTNYQVKIVVNRSEGTDSAGVAYVGDRCLSTYADLRFTKRDGTTLLDYYVDSNYTSSTATVWVEVDSIPATTGAVIFMYYGYASAGAVSSGANTFPYFQSFDSTTLGGALPGGWSTKANTVITYNATNIQVKPSASVGGWYGAYMTPPASMTSATAIVEWLGNTYNTTIAGQGCGITYGLQGDQAAFGLPYQETTMTDVYFNNNGTKYDTTVNETNVDKVWGLRILSNTSVICQKDYANIYTNAALVGKARTYFGLFPSNNGGANPAPGVKVYWLRTRVYTANEPVVGTPEVEEVNNWL